MKNLGTSFPGRNEVRLALPRSDRRTRVKMPSRRRTGAQLLAVAARDAGAWYERISSPGFSPK